MHPRLADASLPRPADGEQVGPGRHLAAFLELSQPLAPGVDALREGAVRPGVRGHGGQVAADDEEARLAAAGRASPRDQLVAERVGELGVADQAVATTPPRGPAPYLRLGEARVGHLVGQQAGGDADQLTGGQGGRVDGGRPEGRLGDGAGELEVGAAAAGGRGGQHGVGQRGAGAAGLVEPAQQLELLGTRQVAAAGLTQALPRLPGRRTAVPEVRHPAPGALLADERSLITSGRGTCGTARRTSAAGPAARPPRGSSPTARRPRRRGPPARAPCPG